MAGPGPWHDPAFVGPGGPPIALVMAQQRDAEVMRLLLAAKEKRRNHLLLLRR
jgi:hypothetical protein